jgi:hypothetical protein
MSKILDRLVQQLMDKGHSKQAAFAIAVASLQKSGNLKKNSTTATKKGKKQGNKTASQRAKERAVKYSKSNKKTSDYKYNKKTNTGTLKG